MVSRLNLRDEGVPAASGDERDPGILVHLGLRPSTSSWDAEALDRRIDATLHQWPVLMIAMLIGSLPAMVEGALNVVPLLLVGLLTLAPVILLWVKRGRALAPVNRMRLLIIASAAAGLWFAALFNAFAKMEAAPLLAMVMTAACFVVVVALARLPATSISFTFGLAAVIFLSGPSLTLFALVLAPALAATFVAAATNARLDFADSRLLWRAEQEASRPARLLDEIEARGSVWFWETDRRGRLKYVSARVAHALGAGQTELIGRPLPTIVDPSLAADDTGLGESGRTLSFLLTTQTAFEGHVARAATEEEVWWSISGRPVHDRFGQLRGFIGTGTDLTAAKRSEAEVARLARFDPLTGLANRAEIGNLLKQAISRRSGAARPAALLLLDLDRFKNVNDTLGHPVGDELLKQVAQRLVDAVSANGHVGRLGGDEFQVVLSETNSRAQVAAVANAIISSVSRPYFLDRAKVSIGVSIGVALAPDDGRTVSDLTRNADLALYAAKAAGRGVHRFYEKEMHAAADRRTMLEKDLTDALERGKLRVVYQSVVTCRTEQVTGFEALVRWTHPDLGPISPAEFIPVAEESNLIERVGEWVLRTACAEAASWPVAARVAVNVSPTQFANPAFPNLVAQVLSKTGLAPDRLELEITESVFMADDGNVERQFDMLRRLGVRLALDDFGTGYSSLGYLQRAPFNKIKIDQSFVFGATEGHNQNAAIIRSIVTLAEALGMETTAEGAETEDQIELIRRLGCSHIQGFYYGPPIEAEDLRERMLRSGQTPSRSGHKSARPRRLSLLRRARLILPGGAFDVRARNISVTGMMVEMSAPLPVGTRGQVDIQDGPTIDVESIWWADGRCGLAFAEAIDLGWITSGREPRRMSA